MQRYLAAGPEAIDSRALAHERLQRSYSSHPLSRPEMRSGAYREALDSLREEMVLVFGEQPETDDSSGVVVLDEQPGDAIRRLLILLRQHVRIDV